MPDRKKMHKKKSAYPFVIGYIRNSEGRVFGICLRMQPPSHSNAEKHRRPPGRMKIQVFGEGSRFAALMRGRAGVHRNGVPQAAEIVANNDLLAGFRPKRALHIRIAVEGLCDGSGGGAQAVQMRPLFGNFCGVGYFHNVVVHAVKDGYAGVSA